MHSASSQVTLGCCFMHSFFASASFTHHQPCLGSHQVTGVNSVMTAYLMEAATGEHFFKEATAMVLSAMRVQLVLLRCALEAAIEWLEGLFEH